jgi:hypothetical protein
MARLPLHGLTLLKAQENCPDRCQDRNSVRGYVGLAWINQLHPSGSAAFLTELNDRSHFHDARWYRWQDARTLNFAK